MTTIAIRSLSKRYGGDKGPRAVNRINLDIASGELLSLLGPSGCGKSTTLLMLAGIYRPTEGSIAFGGQDVTFTLAKQRGIGMVFQNYALYPSMTVLENITFPLKHQGVPKKERRARAAQAAALVELGALLDRHPSQLSGGQCQRVALARAIVKRPRILLLDEPMSNLDPRLRLEMRTEVRRLQQELGITTVLVTHDQDEAMSVSDRIAVMSDGVIQQVGTPDELFRAPARHFVARFLGTPPINDLAAAFDGAAGELQLDDGSPVPLAPGDRDDVGALGDGTRVRVGIRPQQVTVQADGREPPAGRMQLAGVVNVVENAGHHLVVSISTGAGTVRGVAEWNAPLRPGLNCTATMDGPFHLFDENGDRIGVPDLVPHVPPHGLADSQRTGQDMRTAT